uniref:Uncharacterized protein n=1 Tax=Micrurus paraensis TaxID=1970185 RepID=A0A2D4KXH0_9SAUR
MAGVPNVVFLLCISPPSCNSPGYLPFLGIEHQVADCCRVNYIVQNRTPICTTYPHRTKSSDSTLHFTYQNLPWKTKTKSIYFPLVLIKMPAKRSKFSAALHF